MATPIQNTVLPETGGADINAALPKKVKLTFACPKQLRGDGNIDRRRKLGYEISAMLDADEFGEGDLPAMNDQIDELYLGRKVESLEPPWEGAPTYNAKTLGTKIKQLVSFVVGPMTGSDPYFILRAGGPKGNPVDVVQSVLHFFLYRAKYSLALTEAVNLVARRGRCPVRVTYQKSRQGADGKMHKPRLKIEPIDLQYFRAYPNTATEFEDFRCHGHLYTWRVQQVDEAQAAGQFFADYAIRSGSNKNLTMGGESADKQSTSTTSVFRPDDPVDLASVLVKYDLDGDGYEELYMATVARNLKVLLKIEPFQLDQSWYGDFFFERETGRYRPENTVANDLVDTHHFVNDQLNLQVWLPLYMAIPTVFVDSWALPDDDMRTRPGEIIATEGGGKVFSTQGNVNIAPFQGLFQIARTIADEVSRISQNGSGAAVGTRPTATEITQISQGQSTGIQGYSSAIAHGACDLARIALELLYYNFDDWYQHYSNVVPEVHPEDLAQDYWITVNGETPMDTPQGVMQQLTQIMGFVAEIAQINPQVLSAFPDLIPNLLRLAMEASTLPGKETVLPTREEEAATKAAQAQMMQQAQALQAMQANASAQGGQPNGAGDGGVLQQSGMGVPQGAPAAALPVGAGQAPGPGPGGAPGGPGPNPGGMPIA